MGERVAVLLDGEFVKKVLGQRLQKFPESADILGEVARIMKTPCLSGHHLYRVFYYTADPLRSTVRHPLSGQKIEFGATSNFARNSRLIDRVENSPDVAVRRGTLVHQGWQLGRASTKAMPAMKLARREGLRVLLDPLGSAHVRPELKIHADRVI